MREEKTNLMIKCFKEEILSNEIQTQVEYYFSNQNLRKDKFMIEKMDSKGCNYFF
jgi:uncharacterized protein (DUF2164 family)